MGSLSERPQPIVSNQPVSEDRLISILPERGIPKPRTLTPEIEIPLIPDVPVDLLDPYGNSDFQQPIRPFPVVPDDPDMLEEIIRSYDNPDLKFR